MILRRWLVLVLVLVLVSGSAAPLAAEEKTFDLKIPGCTA